VNRDDDTNNPKDPPQSVLRPQARSAALLGLLASVVVFVALIGLALIFWTVAHPRPAAREGMERGVGRSGYYWTEGGRDPARPPRTTRDELKFRGALTPPSEVRDR
jgi:hypothetical protein